VPVKGIRLDTASDRSLPQPDAWKMPEGTH